MDISTLEDFLTYLLKLMIMIIIVFISFDFILFLIDSWRQVSSSSQPDFYQQVKDALWDETDLLTSYNSSHANFRRRSGVAWQVRRSLSKTPKRFMDKEQNR